mmetsp:Transcript_9835/g.34270  ORF Transcript_9835/g.34270 Transcript_9835/m.34270 type:complete len:203 (-) Transcript_9835:660-1268(-)
MRRSVPPQLDTARGVCRSTWAPWRHSVSGRGASLPLRACASTAASTSWKLVTAPPATARSMSPSLSTSDTGDPFSVPVTRSTCLRTGSVAARRSTHSWLRPNEAALLSSTGSSSTSSVCRLVGSPRSTDSTAPANAMLGIPRTNSRSSPFTCLAKDAHSARTRPASSVSTPLKVYPKSMSSSTTSSFTARKRGTSGGGTITA